MTNDEIPEDNLLPWIDAKSFVIPHSDFVIKKIPPPTPEGREGRLFPPEQSSKTAELLNELCGYGN
jgi:hypothetical protein